MRLARFLAAVVLLAGGAGAQIAVDGVVRPLQGPTICMQGETHFLECTRVFLRSRAVNLKQYEGRIVRVVGRNVGLLCVVIDVQAVQPAPGRLTWTGSPVPSCPVTFQITGPGLSRYWFFLGSGTAFIPVDPTLGTVLILPPWLLIQAGSHGGQTKIPIRVPADPGLIGLRFDFQGLVQAIGPVGPLQTTNAVCVTIRAGPRCP